jgi:hypothetical protein
VAWVCSEEISLRWKLPKEFFSVLVASQLPVSWTFGSRFVAAAVSVSCSCCRTEGARPLLIQVFAQCVAVIAYRWSRYCSWVTGLKDSSFPNLNWTHTTFSTSCTQDIWWNTCKDLGYLLIRFLSSVSHVFLPGSIHVSVVVPNLVPRADSFSIAIWS